MGDRRVDRVFGEVTERTKIVCRRMRLVRHGTELLLHFVGGLPGANDNLADAYLADGRKDLARQHAEKALALLDSHAAPASSWIRSRTVVRFAATRRRFSRSLVRDSDKILFPGSSLRRPRRQQRS